MAASLGSLGSLGSGGSGEWPGSLLIAGEILREKLGMMYLAGDCRQEGRTLVVGRPQQAPIPQAEGGEAKALPRREPRWHGGWKPR